MAAPLTDAGLEELRKYLASLPLFEVRYREDESHERVFFIAAKDEDDARADAVSRFGDALLSIRKRDDLHGTVR